MVIGRRGSESRFRHRPLHGFHCRRHNEYEEYWAFTCPLTHSNLILYLHLFIPKLEVDHSVCVQARHHIDEVVGQTVATQHLEECRSRNGIKCLNQINKRDISLEVMLLSLLQCHEKIESTIDGPSLRTKPTLILWSVLLHDAFQPLYHHARQDL